MITPRASGNSRLVNSVACIKPVSYTHLDVYKRQVTLVLSAAGLPLEGIGYLVAIDRVLDMMRTMTNVTGQMPDSYTHLLPVAGCWRRCCPGRWRS